MKTIPVLMNFDSTQPIGGLTIDETRLPLGDGYVFSLGYTVVKTEKHGDEFVVKKIDLLCVSLQTDEQYLSYLKERGRPDQPPATGPYQSPDWNKGGRVHNWRTYISDDLRRIWHTFTPEQKQCIGQSAEDSASREDWD